ncbi:phage holin family protein [Geotalea sp. SG265]|uniref:phage holin family protein n=1 Tax=Geotalea sp. SG265 TaxID=2922867 RepID=UPI001FB025A7|nr:phage holin family protein [Geotalea sp. SG265]
MTEKKDRPLGDLFSELIQETRTLFRKEMELMRVEVSEKLDKLVKDAVAVGVAAVLLYAGLLTLIAAIVFGLAVFIPLWLSALLISIVFIGIGAGLLLKAKKDVSQMKLTPEKSQETLKETAQWAKAQMKPVR